MTLRFLVCGIAATLVVAICVGGISTVHHTLEGQYRDPIDLNIPPIASDKSVKYDYDIVYVRAACDGDKVATDTGPRSPTRRIMDPGADLMLLHPDGSEEVLVEPGQGLRHRPGRVVRRRVGLLRLLPRPRRRQASAQPRRHGRGHLQDPRQDAEDRPADAPGVHAQHRRRRLVDGLPHAEQQDKRRHSSYGVFNWARARCPAGGSCSPATATASARRKGYPRDRAATVRHGRATATATRRGNVEKIGHLNIARALHPAILKDGRIMFSSLESRGCAATSSGASGASTPTARTGTRWSAPSIPATARRTRSTSRRSSPTAASSSRSTTTRTTAASAPTSSSRRDRRTGTPAFGPGYMQRPAQHAAAPRPASTTAEPQYYRLPFSPYRHRVADAVRPQRRRAAPIRRSRRPEDSPRVGKFTHPSGAPDNHLLTVWSPGPVNHQYTSPARSSTAASTSSRTASRSTSRRRCCSSRTTRSTTSNGRGRSCPTSASTASTSRSGSPPLANDGKLSTHLPEGTPFGLVGTSSLYKRESYPDGVVPKGSVTATYAGGNDPYERARPVQQPENGASLNWDNQGADAGLYTNDDIHAIRILAMEPTTDRNAAEVRPAVLQPRQRAAAHPRRDPACASSATDGKQPTRPRRQPRHQLPGQDPRRRRRSRSRRSTRTAWC